MERETTRQRIADELREAPATPSELGAALGISPSTVVEHVRHLAQSLSPTDERILVSPPRCRDCGFDDFDEPANRPSRCPACRSESIEEPTFVVR